VSLTDEILLHVTSSLVYGEEQGKRAVESCGGGPELGDVADALILVSSDEICCPLRKVSDEYEHQILKVLDLYSDGRGLRSTRSCCKITLGRYRTFRATVLGHLFQLKRTCPDKWTIFLEDLRDIKPLATRFYAPSDLNEVGLEI
jgi:hypothetical protein